MTKRATLSSLRRMALFSRIEVESPLHGRHEIWETATTETEPKKFPETEAQKFLLGLEQNLKEWVWPLRVRAVLEDETPLDVDFQLSRGEAARGLRKLLARHYGVKVLRHGIPVEDSLEAVRITELLEGESFPRRGEMRYSALVYAADQAVHKDMMDRRIREGR